MIACKMSKVVVALVTIFLVTTSSWAQSSKTTTARISYSSGLSATVSGSVVDAQGAAVVGARITVVNHERGFRRTTTSNDEGLFDVPFLMPGEYVLTIEMAAFATVSVTGVVASSGMTSKVEITLEPKGVVESVTVEAKANTVDSSDATVKYTLTKTQVEAHPVIATPSGRSLLAADALVMPGIYPGYGPRGEGLVINGARPLSNSFSIDGGDANDYELNRAATPIPNPDAVKEVSILTNNFKADMGGATGGILNAVIKSGTNDFHGNIRYFISNEALNARGFFDSKRLRDRLNTPGGQLGGPLTIPGVYSGKDRTHFFLDFERNVTGRDQFATRPVLSLAERSGDFSNLPLPDPEHSFLPHRPIDPLTGQPFPGGIIPPDRIDPIARYYMDRFIPLPNEGLTKHRFRQQINHTNSQVTARVDHRINNNETLGITYLSNNLVDSNGFDIGVTSNIQRDELIVGRWTWSRSRTVNQFTGSFGWTRKRQDVDIPGFTGVHPREAGFIGVVPQSNESVSLPSMLISNSPDSMGVFGGNPRPLGKANLAFKDDLIHSRGGHRLGTGISLRFFRINNISSFTQTKGVTSGYNGYFEFVGLPGADASGSGLAAFLLGLPDSYGQAAGSEQYGRQNALALYAADDWRLTPNLTVNLGLRYELTQPMVDKLDQVSVFRAGQQSIRYPNAPTGQLFVGDPDPILGKVPRGGYPMDKNNFAPRLGVAYLPHARSGWLGTLLGDGKTVLRAGAGIVYGVTYGLDFSDLNTDSSFSYGITLSRTGPPSQRVGSFANPFANSVNPFPVRYEDRQFSFSGDLHTVDPHFRTSYGYHYNLTIQRELPRSLLLEAGYVGSDTFKTERQIDLNPVTLIPGRHRGSSPYPEFRDLLSQVSNGRARYDSLQVRLSRRFVSGVLIDGSYTYAKSLDNGTSPRNADLGFFGIFNSDARLDEADNLLWARSSFDRRHSFAVSYVYLIPGTGRRGTLGQLLNGWQIGGITQLRSGMPVDLLAGDAPNYNLLYNRADLVAPYQRFDPRQVRTFTVNGETITGNFFFDPTAFREAPPGQAGTLGRNVIEGPGINLTAISLAKRTTLPGNHQLELRADIDNLFNHANFTELYPYADEPQFGRVFRTLPARRIQLCLRYRF